MSLDLVHFPNFKKGFFGSSSKTGTLELLCRVRDEIGCQHISHVSRTRLDETVRSNPSDLSVVMTFPTSWILRYSAKNYFSVDPMVQDDSPLLRNDAAGTLRNLELDADVSPEVKEFIRDGQKHGLGNLFVAVGATNAHGFPGSSLFTFEVGDEDKEKFIEKMRPRLLSASSLIHNSLYGTKEGVVSAAAASLLTRREVDCLRWAASGKTDGEIAEILNIARWTVVTYLQNAKIKLGCSNRTSAVATALSLGIIDMPDSTHLQS
ncbi:LuxR family transcriptional regulator [Phyllobacterium salinisoli]|uniref:LuxR family transcriptional regulator n=1 Tax=Phyllobacterium salinisoli TaxID=1899321 RepID=A0A368K3I7_9HYPH|nr:LuxR family transcriptional regulator [Phyllobacterium salinisoli]RCS23958.1 LuxR family transcriptional regulator [Phyllobacterium salinisoli]